MKIILILLFFISSINAEVSMEEFDRACSEMKWIQEGEHELPQSGAEFDVPNEHILLLGNDAIRYRHLVDCIAIDESIEGVMFSKHEPYDSVILKSYHNEGYISSEDWKEIDASELLAAIIAGTEEANEQRLSQGIEEKVTVVGWLKEPTRENNTISWAIEALQGEEAIVNAVALKLGRYGYEEFTWVTPKEYYSLKGGELDIALNAHRFKIGHRYEDYTSGDRLASYGVAGLVAAVAGAKAVKAIGFGSLLVLLKKFAGIVFAGCVGAFYSIKKFFNRKKEQKCSP